LGDEEHDVQLTGKRGVFMKRPFLTRGFFLVRLPFKVLSTTRYNTPGSVANITQGRANMYWQSLLHRQWIELLCRSEMDLGWSVEILDTSPGTYLRDPHSIHKFGFAAEGAHLAGSSAASVQKFTLAHLTQNHDVGEMLAAPLGLGSGGAFHA
jgi:hypothetical protein